MQILQKPFPFAILRRAHASMNIGPWPSTRSIDQTNPTWAAGIRARWAKALAAAMNPTPRTAEDERRDTLAFIRRIADDALDDDRAYYLDDMHQRIARGDHEGASTR